ADHQVSIQSMNQTPDEASTEENKTALLAFVTHRAKESQLAKTLRATQELDGVKEDLSVMRVEGNEFWHHRPPHHLQTEYRQAPSATAQPLPPRGTSAAALIVQRFPC